MTEYVQISCTQCSRGLRVRFEYIGREIACNHCNHSFIATSRDPRALKFLIEQNGSSSAQLRTQIATLTEDLAAANDRAAAVEQQHRQHLEQLELQLAKQREEHDGIANRLNEQIAQLQTAQQALLERTDTIRADRDRIAASLAQSESEQRSAVGAWDEERDRLHDSLEDLRRQLSAAADYSTKLNEQAKTLDTQVVELRGRDTQYQRTVVELESAVQQADAKYRELATVLEKEQALRTQVERGQHDAAAAWDNERTELTGRLEESRQRIDSSTEQIAGLLQQSADLEVRCAELETNSRRHQDTLSKLQISLRQAKDKNARLAKRLGTAHSKHARVEQDRLEAALAWSEERAGLHRTVDETRRQLETATRQAADLARHSEHLQARLAELETCESRQTEAIAEFEISLKQAEDRASRLASELELQRGKAESDVALWQQKLTSQQERVERELQTVAAQVELFREKASASEHGNRALQLQSDQLRQELERVRLQAQAERQDSAARLEQEQLRSEQLKRQWDEKLVALEQECERLAADASEVVQARKTQLRSIVKIARLTRTLERTWKQIELLRRRNQQLAGSLRNGICDERI